MTELLTDRHPGAGVGPQQPLRVTPVRAAGVDPAHEQHRRRPLRRAGRRRAVFVAVAARDLATDRRRTGRRSSPSSASNATLDADARAAHAIRPTRRARARAARRAARVAAGFRRAAVDGGAGATRRADLLYLLLDDLPVATLVSGYALQRAGLVPHHAALRAVHPTVDLCSGWAADATLMQVIERSGADP